MCTCAPARDVPHMATMINILSEVLCEITLFRAALCVALMTVIRLDQ